MKYVTSQDPRGKGNEKNRNSGYGCMRCAEITERAEQAVKELGIDAEVSKVPDPGTVANYGVLGLPALDLIEQYRR